MDFKRGVGDELGTHLPQIVRENELQKTIADERMRAEQHKSNYQTLKLDYLRLQQDFTVFQNAMSSTLEEMNIVREKDKALLEQARQEIIKKVKEIEHLKTQVMDPQKVKLIQIQLEGELEKPYKEKLKQLEGEADALRNEYNKLRTEHIFLKSEYENDRKQYAAILEENKLRHEAEIMRLRYDKDSNYMYYHEDSLQDFNRFKDLQMENTRLITRNKNLEDELVEIRNQKVYSTSQTDSVTKVNSKVVADYQSTIKAFEAERQMLKSQVENLHKELRSLAEEKNHAVNQKFDLERKNASMNNRIEELEHRIKKEVCDVRIEMVRERGKVEHERNNLRNLYEDARAELEVLQETVSKFEESLVEKEKEIARKVQMAKEEQWQKLHSLETEKIEIETKLKEYEKRISELEAEKAQLVDKLETRIQEIENTKESLEKEIISLRSKLGNQQILLDQLEHEKVENSNLKNRLSRMESQFVVFSEGERDVLEKNEDLERQITEMEKELQMAKMEILKSKEAMEKESSDKISSWMEERCRLQARVDELESHLRITQRKLATGAQSYKQKKLQMKKLLLRYREQIYNLNARLEQGENNTGISGQDSSEKDVELLKRKMKNLIQKNHEFWSLLTSTQLQQKNIGGLPFASVSYDFLPISNGNLEWGSLKKKMEDLDLKLKNQLDEMKGKQYSKSTLEQEKVADDSFVDKENDF